MTNLEFVRRKLGLSQLELGKRAGIHSTAIVQVERGHRKPWPKFRKLMATELCVLEEELFNINGWPIEKI
jgi:putative transcriptional regulator